MQPIPLTLRGVLGTANSPLKPLEQLAASAGLKISRYSAITDVNKKAEEFKKNSMNPKLRAAYERDQKTTYPESEYRGLRIAIENQDLNAAQEEYKKLLKTKSHQQISENMRMGSTRPFISKSVDPVFRKSLSDEDKKAFDAAIVEKKKLYADFLKIRQQLIQGARQK